MTTDNKTLADMQPGGRVRLGDQAERARFEAWAHGECLSLHRWPHSGEYSDDRTSSAWKAWQFMLSAQPSPGGQGDARDMLRQFGQGGRLREGSRAVGHDGPDRNDWEDYIEVPVSVLDRIAAALAARQPVGEPVGVTTLVHSKHFDKTQCTFMRSDVPEGTKLYVAPLAQAVDLGQIIEQIAQQWDGCSYDAVGETIDVGQAIRAAGKRLIDSQAVGNA